MITDAYEKTGSSVGAAKQLGISQPRAYRLIKNIRVETAAILYIAAVSPFTSVMEEQGYKFIPYLLQRSTDLLMTACNSLLFMSSMPV